MRLPVISKALQRYRVSRGYGVHSPFAYRFIIRVLRETLPYYGFDRLNSLRGDMSAADARLLFRITDFSALPRCASPEPTQPRRAASSSPPRRAHGSPTHPKTPT